MPIRPIHWATAAAVLLIAVGAAAFAFMEVAMPEGIVVPPPMAAAPLPTNLAESLVERHEACLRSGIHRQSVAAGSADVERVRLTLENQLSQTVFGLNPKEPGWKLVGAARCEINGRQIAHLEFVRGPHHVSVMSMPISACSVGVGETVTYDGEFNGHPIAAFRDRSGVFALVGSAGGISLDELGYLREYLLRGEGACGSPFYESVPTSTPADY